MTEQDIREWEVAVLWTEMDGSGRAKQGCDVFTVQAGPMEAAIATALVQSDVAAGPQASRTSIPLAARDSQTRTFLDIEIPKGGESTDPSHVVKQVRAKRYQPTIPAWMVYGYRRYLDKAGSDILSNPVAILPAASLVEALAMFRENAKTSAAEQGDKGIGLEIMSAAAIVQR